MDRSRGDKENDVPDDVSILDRRALTRLFPALRLIGAIRLAFDLRKLIIAAIGVVLLQLGWSLFDRLIPAAAGTTPDVLSSVLRPDRAPGGDFGIWYDESGLRLRTLEPIRILAAPLLALVQPARGWGEMLHSLLSLTWAIAVWGICGGAICRIAIVQAAQARQTGIVEALRFALKNAQPLIVAPLCPLLGAAFCAALCATYGLAYRVPAVGPTLAGIGLVLPLALGLVMTLLLAGLLAGWPLLQAALAGGAEDALDAVSRVFGYLNQRLGPFAALLVLAWFEALIGLALVDLLTSGIIRVTVWGLGLSAPASNLSSYFGEPSASAGGIGWAVHGFWLGTVNLLAHCWIYGFFWTAAAFLYLWLRHDVDGTPWTEVDPPAPIAPASS
jgi:hypothetical protein